MNIEPDSKNSGNAANRGPAGSTVGRKQTDEELLHMYQTFVNQSHEAIYCTEFDQPIDISLPMEKQIDAIYDNAYMGFCNQAMSVMYGFASSDEFSGQRLEDFHGGRDNPTNRATFRKFIESNYRSVDCETEEVTPQGDKRFFLSNDIGIVDNGHLLRIWGTAINITGRKQAEEELRESEMKYSSLFNSMLEGFALHEIICDESGKPVDYRFLDMNPAFEKLTGLKKADAVGKTVLTVLPETEYFWIETYGKVALTGKPVSFENYSGAIKRYYQVIAFSPQKRQFAVIFSDITERKLADEALRESAERHQAILQTAMDGYCKVDIQGCLLEVNETYCRMTGYSEQELLLMHISDIEFDGTPENTAAHIQKLITHGEARFESRHRRKDGTIFDVEVSVQHRTAENNLVAFIHDITKRKLAEAALRSKTALLEAQVNASPYGILVVDENNKRILTNRRVVELYNVPPHILADEDDSALLNHVASLTSNPEQFMGKVMYLNSHRDETSRDEIEFKNGMALDRYSAPVLGKNGEYYGRIWTFNDITERKRAEKYREMGQEVLQILNAPGYLEHSIQRVLAAFKKYTGFDAVGIRLQSGDDFPYFVQQGFANDFLLKENTLIEHCANGGVCRDKDGNISLECTCGLVISGKTNPDSSLFTRGGSFWTNDSSPILELPADQDPRHHPRNECIHQGYASVALVPIRNKDRIVGLIQFNDRRKGCFSLDIIETIEGVASHIGDALMRKEAEEELIKAKEKAEESDRLKSAFLANMSHEIRTPMNGILGFTELLKEPKLSGEEQQEYIRIIEESGDRMLNTINDIISISKIEAGQMPISVSETNVNEQIEYIYAFFKPEVEKKGIQFSLKTGLPAAEAIIRTDREKLYAVLTNLVKNAIKFTFSGAIEIGYQKKDQSLEFFVQDTGIAIPQNKLEAVFDRFVQVHVGDKRAFQGSGLGLSISKAYVEMLGGRIWVESESGKGSVFYFTIPYRALESNIAKDTFPAEEKDRQIRPLKILIAEDDEKSEMLITLTVKKFGREILKARTGGEAVEACRNNPDIDLVLMDIEMPQMDGYEATRQIRQFNQNVVIIAQTAYALTEEKEKALGAGCNDHIAKPFKQGSLLALLSKYF
ncbi:MAG: PAS domain S-box protein [Victivallaceae bacterium]